MKADPFGLKPKLTEKPHQATVCLRFQHIKCDSLRAQCDLSILCAYALFIFSVVQSPLKGAGAQGGAAMLPLLSILLLFVLYIGIYWYNSRKKIMLTPRLPYDANLQVDILKRLHNLRFKLRALNGTVASSWLVFFCSCYFHNLQFFQFIACLGAALYLCGMALLLRLLSYFNQAELANLSSR